MKVPQSITSEFLILKSAFENGSIRRMSDLEKQKPTRIASLSGINQGRYVAKLYNPSNFTPSEIVRISLIIDIDPGLIMNVIKLQVLESEMSRILKNLSKINSKMKEG